MDIEELRPWPAESHQLEFWIHRQIMDDKPASQIADECLKEWEKGHLTVGAKATCARFCILNGFFSALLRGLRKDLDFAQPLPWGICLEVLLSRKIEFNKELVDACLIGAGVDHQLHFAAASALLNYEKDPRWSKILNSELREKLSAAYKVRDKLLEEIEIFKREGMQDELRESAEKILTLFPDDKEVQGLSQGIHEVDLNAFLGRLRKTRERRTQKNRLEEVAPQWPELGKRLKEIEATLDLESCVELAIGLHEMGFIGESIECLRSQEKSWTLRERLLEAEFLIDDRQFAEALERSQRLLKEKANEPEVVWSALYYSAKSYHGLGDNEQAVAIISALLKHAPDYRDAALLLREWKEFVS